VETPVSVVLRDRFVSILEPAETEGLIAPPISDVFLEVLPRLFDLILELVLPEESVGPLRPAPAPMRSAGCLVVAPVVSDLPRDREVEGCLVVICLPIRDRKLFEFVNPFRLLVIPDLLETEFECCRVVI
jgi:hypothetical protein